MSKDYYETLGVPRTASQDEIRKAFRKLAGENHPDRGGNAERFKEINHAHQVRSYPVGHRCNLHVMRDSSGVELKRSGVGKEGGKGFGSLCGGSRDPVTV